MDESSDEVIFQTNKISKLTFCVVCFFGIGSWIALNGIWVELPNLIHETPEGWKLASYLSVICQLGNVGMLLYLFLRRYIDNNKLQHYTILIITTFGGVALILLSAFWNETTFIFGTERSLALIILVFVVSICDCTSSVTFLPFMVILPGIYLSPLYVGESLSGLLPGLVALAQGTYKTNNITSPKQNEISYKDGMNFSQEIFFLLLAFLMFLSPLSYLLIKYLPSIKKLHILHLNFGGHNEEASFLVNESDITDSSCEETVNVNTKLRLLFIMLLLNVLQNGVLTSISSYSYAPYGNVTYHLAATLGAIFAALSSFLYLWLPTKSTKVVYLLSVCYFALAVLIFSAALKSPNPWLKSKTIGRILAVLVSIITSSLVSYTKLTIASMMMNYGDNYLLYSGIAIQIGGFLGAVVMFPIVNFTHVFKSG